MLALSVLPFPLILLLTFIVGLCVGSFLNVVGLRFLAEEDITVTPSHCPQCNTPIRPIDNIPVLSYILLGGHCRACKTPISIQYPLIELATGVLFCGIVWQFGLGWQTLFLLFFIANLVVIFITDLRESLIFQINSLSLVPAGLLYNTLLLGPVKTSFPVDLGLFTLAIPDALVSGLLGVIVAIVFFEGLILLSNLVFGTEGFGHGDTHLMMGAGAFLGWPLTVLALILGFIAQTIPAIPMLIIQWIRNRQYLSLISGGISLLGATSPVLLNMSGLDPNSKASISLVCLIVSLIALLVFLKQIKHSQNFTYLPLGPALVLGILIALFYGEPILSGYQSYLLHR